MNRTSIASAFAACLVACAGGTQSSPASDAGGILDGGEVDSPSVDSGRFDAAHVDSGHLDAGSGPDTGLDAAGDGAAQDAAGAGVDAGPTTLDLHEAMIFDNPPNLADWPVTTLITDVEFQYMGMDGVHVEFSKRDGAGSWPDVTPPGWGGSLEYTLGFAELINGQWYASAAIQFWRGLPASGGNVATDVVTMGQCTVFGYGSSCQIAKNWYYDGRWGPLATYQPATGETIGVFVVAGNVRGVTDGSQSPVEERSNVVLVSMPDINGAKFTF